MFAFLAYTAANAFYYQGLLGPVLERDLGFRHGACYYRVKGRQCSAVAFRAIDDGGILACAGFRTSDVIPRLSLTDLFRLLHSHRGREVELTVVEGGDGLALEQRPRRVLRFVVPANEK
ncbi:MAG: hypothetical protein O2955_08335 [Planctomycetota bacterium]|nr:hypothetical protein [Planctomycetota bacterium]MDA1212511.1 hypothetical protein [Planctomycetota bacterium]